ncbi:hypothetical protein [Cylindrospermum stagnale]|uniref:hypothetical protein n=1 Tax=Cylindrospermum stagnale TaxID=142864 RepID=UPI0002FA4A4D|nr:hypothetical protein [Cylindrospermum stagnale]
MLNNPPKLAQFIQHILEADPRKIDNYAASIDFAQQLSWENRITKIFSYLEDQRP